MLSDDYEHMTSRQFEAHIRGLLIADTRIGRHFAPKEDRSGQ